MNKIIKIGLIVLLLFTLVVLVGALISQAAEQRPQRKIVVFKLGF